MRRSSTPAAASGAPDDTLADLVGHLAATTPDLVLFERPVRGLREPVTAAQWADEVARVALGFAAAGVTAGDRVAIMSRTRYEWTLVDFALWTMGAVPVPIYETSSAEQVEWILSDSAAVGVVVESASLAHLVADVRHACPQLRKVWTLDEGAVDDLAAAGARGDVADLPQLRAGVGRSSLATLIYTSGTTGRPKGVELTHGNFLFDATSAVTALDALFEVADASTLLFLPLAHVFARDIEIACVIAGVRVTHCPDVKELATELKAVRPSFVLAVPRVFEKIYNGAEQRATAEGKGRIFATAAQVAIEYSQALDHGTVSTGLRLRHALLDRLVYRKLREAMGGNVSWAISGGAALGARLGHFFRGIGVTVLEGYGLTESTAAATVNTPARQRVGSVGRPLPGTEVAISDDGEVWLRGPHIMRGYWNNPHAGHAVVDPDGWFRTGDLGVLDDDGYLTITGRLKEILVTSGGKNVAPAVLEDRLRAHRLISQAMVVGDARPYVAALITLDPDAVPGWLDERGRSAADPRDLVDDPDIRATVGEAVAAANLAVSKAEAIKRFVVLPVDLTEHGGHLTPTLKMRRHAVANEFAAEIEALYS